MYEQIKLLELEKASTQNDLDNVLKLATQQNNSFTKMYEEVNYYEALLFLFFLVFYDQNIICILLVEIKFRQFSDWKFWYLISLIEFSFI